MNTKSRNIENLSRALGWFSVGLGLIEILAPRQVGRFTGMGKRTRLLRIMGIRELISGLGILSGQQPSRWVWSRVGGDVLDLAVLGCSIHDPDSRPTRLAGASLAIAGIAALDVVCGRELSNNGHATTGAIRLEKSIIIKKSPEELFQFWRDFENLPRFMKHLRSIRVVSQTRSHWITDGPAGTQVEWDAEIINESPNELIAWRSIEGSDLDHSGSVRFERAPGNRGTIVRVKMQYCPPAGRVGIAVAKLLGGSPERHIRSDLYRLKQVIETGEIARTEGQPTGGLRGNLSVLDTAART